MKKVIFENFRKVAQLIYEKKIAPGHLSVNYLVKIFVLCLITAGTADNIYDEFSMYIKDNDKVNCSFLF